MIKIKIRNVGNSLAAIAAKSFQQWNYLKAAFNARASFQALATAAEALDIPLAPEKPILPLIPNLDVPHQGDPIRYPNN